MARFSTHILDATNGTHAGGVPVVMKRLTDQGTSQLIFDATTDTGGRLVQDLDLTGFTPSDVFEVVFNTKIYWERSPLSIDGQQMEEIVLRFSMKVSENAYHMPIILSPNGYSTWLSS